MKYKLAIFDLDGTVLDTLNDLADSVNYALKKNHFPERSLDEIRSYVGNGIRLLIDRSVPEFTSYESIDKVFNDFKLYYSEHSCDKTRPYDGIVELLNCLRQNGIITAVVSNKADFAVQTLVNRYFNGLFDYYAGEREFVAKKPAPDSVYDVIYHFNFSFSDAVYIGDSEVDIQTAYNAKIDSVIVDWGFRDRDFLINSGASVVLSSVDELSDYLLNK